MSERDPMRGKRFRRGKDDIDPGRTNESETTMTADLPLTPAADGILHGQLLDPDNPAYWTGELCRLDGPINVDRLADAIAATIVDAEALHATIHDIDGEPRQRIRVNGAWRPDIRAVTCESDVDAAIAEMLGTAADLTTGPLFRGVLFVGAGTVWWYLQAHHIVIDGFAYALLSRQIERRYRGADVDGFERLTTVLTHLDATRDDDRDRRFWINELDGVDVAGFARGTVSGADRPITHRLDTTALDASGHRWPHVLLAAVAGALHRRTGGDRPVLGLPVSGRLGGPSATTPAMIMNICPLPVPIAPGATLTDTTDAVAAAMKRTRKHQRYRYEQLRRDLGLLGTGRRLFGPVVNVIPFGEPPRFDGCTTTLRHISAGPVDDLAVTARGPRDLLIEANPGAYTADDLAAIADDITDILDNPDRPMGIWRRIDGPPPPPRRTVADRFANHVDDHGGRTALVDGDRTWTYRELSDAAWSVASGLTAHGIGAGDLVALALPRGAEAVIAILGIHLAGAGYLPIDPDGPAERTAAILAEAAPRLTIGATGGDGTVHIDDIMDHSGSARPIDASDDDPAYVIYTSGSTGVPKGVSVPRRALDFFAGAAVHHYGFDADDRVLQFAPLAFDAHIEEVFATIAAGGTLIVRDDSATRSVEEFLAFVAAKRISVLDLPTAYWHELVWTLAHGRGALPETVRLVIIGGEAASADRVADWHATVGADVTLVNSYGPTEATVVCLAGTLRPGDPATLGTPLPGVTALVGPGDELYIGGDGVASGYLGGRDADRFVHIGGERFYRTGDRVTWDGAHLLFRGRVDHEVKISGHRVHPAEVEAALLADPRVRQAAVVVDRHRGAPRLFAFVDSDAPGEEIREAARARLAGPALPTAVYATDGLPSTPTGKIDRSALRVRDEPSTARPRTPMEGTVFSVFAEVNGTEPDTVDSDFFSGGGTSLSAVAAASRLSILLGRTVTAAELFDHPTVAGLAAALDGGASAPDDAARMRDDADWTPPTVAASVTTPTTILTGASGYVGAHVLAELLARTDDRVVCLTRGGSARLAAAARGFGLAEPATDRVTTIDVDLARPGPGLGLASGVVPLAHRVIHCAADVNLRRGYRSLRAVNVEATRWLLEYACRTGAAFHHVSTVAVGAGTALPEEYVAAHAGLADGYKKTKWVAEELVRRAEAAGLAAACHRLGRVVPGAGGAHSPGDLVWRIGRAAITAGAFPDLAVAEPWIAVDVAATAIVGLAVDGRTGVWNLLPEEPTPLGELWTALRRELPEARRLPLADWLGLLRERPDAIEGAVELLSFFDGAQAAPPDPAAINADRFRAWLKDGGPAPTGSTVDDVARALLAG